MQIPDKFSDKNVDHLSFEPATYPTSSYNPWQPMSVPKDLKHMGKLLEELGELSGAASRCLIQGLDAVEPVTLKLNRLWLEEEEIADVLANVDLVVSHFKLNSKFIHERITAKRTRLKTWHDML